MGMREKLIELLYEAEDKCNYADCGQCEYIGLDACGFRMIANHLIANDVVPVVRCKDCRKCHTYNDVITGQLEYKCYLWNGCRNVDADMFCDAGERREGE